jgi:hypothetical protein
VELTVWHFTVYDDSLVAAEQKIEQAAYSQKEKAYYILKGSFLLKASRKQESSST